MEQELIVSKIEKSILNSTLKPAFIPFIVAGYPDLETTKELLYCLQSNNAAAIELGIPFSDPLADGPIIQEAAKDAIDNGTNIKKIFDILDEIKQNIKTPVIIFSYYNLVLNYGISAFIKKAKEVGISGFIIPDLPFEESEDFNRLCKDNNLDQIMLVAPTSNDERLQMIAEKSSGFLYIVSSTGVTGERNTFSVTLADMITRIKKFTNIPAAVGFGVSKPEHINTLKELNVDGAIIGSAIIKIIKQHKEDKTLMIKKLNEYIQSLYSEK